MRNGSAVQVLERAVLFCLPALFVICAAFQAGGAPATFRIPDRITTQQMIEKGAVLIGDYGAFQIVQAEPQTIAAGAERLDALQVIRLNAHPLNTRAPEVQSLRNSKTGFAGRRLHLVQFAGPIMPQWREELTGCGVRIVSYIPQNAYLVYGDSVAIATLQTWAGATKRVQWEGRYEDRFKIQTSSRLSPNVRSQTAATNLYSVQLVEDPEVNAGTLALINDWKAEPIRRQLYALGYVNLTVSIASDRLDQIAAQPDVVSIRPHVARVKLDERQSQILAGNLSGPFPLGPGYLGWLAERGFSQSQFDLSGFVVDVTDSGIDNGTLSPGHFGLRREGSRIGASRVVYSRLEGAANGGSTLEGCDGHGTINAHILGGYSALMGFPHTDAAGYSYELGVCPFVRLGASVIFDPVDFTFPDYADLQSRAYQSGARISANSWGGAVDGEYDVDAQIYDALVRDAQPSASAAAAAGNQQMVLVFAAGNAGPDWATLDSPGSAKNVITVGASENVRSLQPASGGTDGTGSDGCDTSDADANSATDVAVFSSRGPCADGRMKPDLLAPGSHVTGGVPQSGIPDPAGLGSSAACFDASAVCGLVNSGGQGNAANFFPQGQEFYTVSSGTSHATPAVAGACALLRQDFINRGLNPPSPAMTKAFLVNSTRYLTGAGGHDSLWSAAQGMGAVNLGRAFDGVPRILRDQQNSDKFTASGQTRRITGIVNDPSLPFRVTLAWTDAPGSTTGSAYNNDLDLVVTIDGVSYRGNVFNGAYSTNGGSADYRNNMESVFLPAGASGSFAVSVMAANINSDGVPNEAPALDQDFALVIYNGTEANVPVLAVENYSLLSENGEPANGLIDPGETVTVLVGLKNLGSADAMNVNALLMAGKGVQLPGGSGQYGEVKTGGAVATQAFTFTAGAACGDLLLPTFRIMDSGFDLGTVSVSVPVGIRTILSRTFTNSTSFRVPLIGTQGRASLYPSSLTVTGMTGAVSRVSVEIPSLTHSFPDDLDVLLAGPGGQAVMLMSDAGGGISISGADLTFEDGAPVSVPDSAEIRSGTYSPSDYESGDTFPAPAPSGPFGTSLGIFAGTNPNGIWKLFVQDDSADDSGSISQGWRITVTATNLTCSSIVAPPRIASILVENRMLQLSWTAVPGRNYRVQAASDVAAEVWTDLAPDVEATQFTANFAEPVSGDRRFYRVMLVQ